MLCYLHYYCYNTLKKAIVEFIVIIILLVFVAFKKILVDL